MDPLLFGAVIAVAASVVLFAASFRSTEASRPVDDYYDGYGGWDLSPHGAPSAWAGPVPGTVPGIGLGAPAAEPGFDVLDEMPPSTAPGFGFVDEPPRVGAMCLRSGLPVVTCPCGHH